MDKDYIINTDTLALVPITKKKTKVYENNGVYVINKNARRIIEDNCIFFGSSYEGRKRSATTCLGIKQKSPILIEESNDLIFFPTASPRVHECAWIAVNHVENFECCDECESKINFENNSTLRVKASPTTIENQILRATRLESIVHRKKRQINSK